VDSGRPAGRSATRDAATAEPDQVAWGQPAVTRRASADFEAVGARPPVETPSVTAVGEVAAAIPTLSLFGERTTEQQWAQPHVHKRRFVRTRTLEDRATVHRTLIAAACAAAVASADAAATATAAAAQSATASAKYRAAVAAAGCVKFEATIACVAATKAAQALIRVALALANVQGGYLAAANSVGAAAASAAAAAAICRPAAESVAAAAASRRPVADSVPGDDAVGRPSIKRRTGTRPPVPPATRRRAGGPTV